MKPQSFKKLFAFIIIAMVFSALPQFINAQPIYCPKHYKLVCYSKICHCVPKGNGNGIGYNATSQQSIATDFELEHPSIVSIKIYDVTGRPIRTLVDESMQQGLHQLTWNGKDEQGISVTPGIYVLKLQAGNYTEIKKISLML